MGSYLSLISGFEKFHVVSNMFLSKIKHSYSMLVVDDYYQTVTALDCSGTVVITQS